MSIKSKNKKIIDLMSTFYYDNTIIGVLVTAIIIGALVSLFSLSGVKLIPEVTSDKIMKYLIPFFIIVVCLEIFFIRHKILPDVRIIKDSVENFIFKSFETRGRFDDYLKERLKDAKQVRVIRLVAESDSLEGKEERNKYLEVIKKFVESGRIFQRILCASDNARITEWIKYELEEYKNYKYYVYYTNRIRVESIKFLNIMVIDEDEVCLGGGYKKIFENPTISIRNFRISKFFLDFFHELLVESTKLTLENINDLMNKR